MNCSHTVNKPLTTNDSMPGLAQIREAMVTYPKTLPVDASIGLVRELFESDHVHMVLLADTGRLITTIVRGDLRPAMADSSPARTVGQFSGRTVHPETSAPFVLQSMKETSRRRLAVVDRDGMLLGLLCLKRSLAGFCSDSDVSARMQDRPTTLTAEMPTSL